MYLLSGVRSYTAHAGSKYGSGMGGWRDTQTVLNGREKSAFIRGRLAGAIPSEFWFFVGRGDYEIDGSRIGRIFFLLLLISGENRWLTVDFFRVWDGDGENGGVISCFSLAHIGVALGSQGW